MKFTVKLLASGFFTGYFPYFPGTIASLVAVFLAWFLRLGLGEILILTLLGVIFCGKGEVLFAEHDCQKIVYDEFCGMFLAVWGFNHPFHYLAGLLLFRFFDICKPFPINKIQILPGGWGIMADDILAGGMTRIILGLLAIYGII